MTRQRSLRSLLSFGALSVAALSMAIALAGCPSGETCAADEGCSGDDICNFGTCERVACNSDATCGEQRTCTDGICRPFVDDGDEGEGEGDEGEGEGDEGEGEGEGDEGEGEGDEGEGEGEGDEGEGEGEGEGEFVGWDPIEPNNFVTGEDCLSIIYASTVHLEPGEWSDESCGSDRAFVCEIPPLVDIADCINVNAVGRRYAFCQSLRKFDEAELACVSGGGALVRINTTEENAAIVAAAQALFDAEDEVSFWAGASDADTEGEWRWLDGTVLPTERFEAWEAGNPDDSQGEDCLALNMSIGITGTWNDVTCSAHLDVVCEVFEPPTPLPPDCEVHDVGAIEYVFCGSGVTYDDAIATCAEMSGVLVRDFHAAFHADLAAAAAQFLTAQRVWLGADDRAVEGTFLWNDDGHVPLP